MKLRHIEGKTFRAPGGYYLEQHVGGVFYCYQTAHGYGSQKVWAKVQGSLAAALAAIDAHRLEVVA